MRRITRRHALKLGLAAGLTLAGGPACLGQPTAGTGTHTASSSRPLPSPAPITPWPAADEILAHTVVPSFPLKTFTVTDPSYGAAANGSRDNTAAFKRAIEDCSAQGGGHVVVPAGVYRTGAIRLLSNVDLHLEDGATLRFNGNLADYPLVPTRYAGIECINYSPMVYAYGQTNVALTGNGVLDATDTAAWNIGYDFTGILEPLVAAGVPPEQRVVPRYGRLRSAFVEPYGCTNVLIQAVTLRRSLFWQLHPTLCHNVTIDGVTTGDTTALNSDGCDPESCDHVVIKNCSFDANDDCIAIKSGRDADGRRVGMPCQNLVIHSCRLQGPVAGIACGSEMSGGILNVYAYDVATFGRGVGYMLYVKSNTRRGGYAVNVNVDSIQADHIGGAVVFAHMDYNGQTGSYPPTFGEWNLTRMRGDSIAQVLKLSGLPSDPINDVLVRDGTFTNVRAPTSSYAEVTGLTFDNVSINGVPAQH